MNPLIEPISHYLQNSQLAALFLDALLKSFVVLAVAAGLCFCWRRASAATRHLIWLLALVSLPFLPLFSSLLPSWQRPLWSVSSSLVSGNQVSLKLDFLPGVRSGFAPPASAPTPAEAAATSDHQPARGRQLAARFSASRLALVFVTWCGGILLMLMCVAYGQLRLEKISRSARALQNPEWASLLRETRELLQLDRSVILLQSPDNIMPMTWGWWRPVVLLPAEAEPWPAERRRIVLLHELAHVKRRDCLTQLVARIVCALYWFNPLVWLAARRMCVERERACDDLVLEGGCQASDYASHLVEIAQTFRRVPQVAAIAMARSSGLERRVTAILDGCRSRARIAKFAVMFIGLAIAGLEIFIGGYAQERPGTLWSLERSTVGDQLKRFVAEKRAQALAGAKTEGNEILPEYEAMYAAARKGDWNSISNIWENLRVRAPQYDFKGPKDERLHGTGWQTMLEIWGAFGNVAMGGPNLERLAQDAVQSIPAGSIYFGGTDPGRCVITALQHSHVNGEPFFTLTQNALADGTYVQYLQAMYGERIYIATKEEQQKCFDDYVADAGRRLKTKELRPGENVTEVDGKIQVVGQVAVMAINAQVVKIIFDKNPDREFYIEESFPLDWMYPHLSPVGPIMKINRQPLSELSDETVQQDHEYWTGVLQAMVGDWLDYDTPLQTIIAFAEKAHSSHPIQDQYIGDDSAQKWAAKLRSTIAGLYSWRLGVSQVPSTPPQYLARNETERQRMIKEADFAFRQCVALCPYSPEVVFRYVNLLVNQKRDADALLVAQLALRLEPQNGQLKDLVKNVRKAQTPK